LPLRKSSTFFCCLLLAWLAANWLNLSLSRKRVTSEGSDLLPSASELLGGNDEPNLAGSESLERKDSSLLNSLENNNCGRLYPKCTDITRLPTLIDERGIVHCGFDLTNDTHYLPDPAMIRCLRGNPRTMWQRDLRRYEERVLELQSPEQCDRPSSALGDGSWHVVKFTSHGHGVNAFHMATMVGNHWDRGIPVVASLSAYRFGSHQEICQGQSKLHRGWSCHMSPLSRTCSMLDESTKRAIVNTNRMRKPHPYDEWCKPHGRFENEYGRCRCDDGYMPSEDGSHCLNFDTDRSFRDKDKWKPRYQIHHDRRKVNSKGEEESMVGTDHWTSRLAPGEVFAMENYDDPAHWDYTRFISTYPTAHDLTSKLKLKHGFFWWMLQHIWLLHKRAPKREEMERRVREILGSNMECVAVHVRRGDSCDDPTARHRTCPKLDVYAAKVKLLKERYFATDPAARGKRFVVYLASDDPSTIDEAQRMNLRNNADGEWVWQPIDRKRYVNGKVVDNNPALFDDEAMDELYFDLWAMSHCEVGYLASFASSVAWNAYGLTTGRFGYYVPFVSVDWPWGHKILGGHHARGNLFDSTVDRDALVRRMRLFGEGDDH